MPRFSHLTWLLRGSGWGSEGSVSNTSDLRFDQRFSRLACGCDSSSSSLVDRKGPLPLRTVVLIPSHLYNHLTAAYQLENNCLESVSVKNYVQWQVAIRKKRKGGQELVLVAPLCQTRLARTWAGRAVFVLFLDQTLRLQLKSSQICFLWSHMTKKMSLAPVRDAHVGT